MSDDRPGEGAVEVELKLAGTPEQMARLRRSRRLHALAGPAERGRTVSTYYDTPDGRLKAVGAALRIWTYKGETFQTIKLKPSGGGGAMKRLEFETALPDESVFPILPDHAGLAGLIAGAKDALSPILAVDADSWAWVGVFEGARVEVVIDEGVVAARRANGTTATAPVYEAEVELLAGPAAPAFALARELVKDFGLLPSVETKAEIGARAACDAPPGPEKARRRRLSPGASADEALDAALAACARQFIANGAGARAGDPRAIRRLRVALRRLRSIERAFRKTTRSKELAGLVAKAKPISTRLGEARDWHVFVSQTLPALQESVPEGTPDAAGLALLAQRAREIADEAACEARALAAGRDHALLCIDLAACAELAPWRETARKRIRRPARGFAARALDRRLKAARSAAKTFRPRDPVSGHVLRIALKKLRYAAEPFDGVFNPAARKDYLKALRRLQAVFGDMNDAVVAAGRARLAAAPRSDDSSETQAALARAAKHIVKASERDAKTRARVARRAWRAFDALEPFWRDA